MRFVFATLLVAGCSFEHGVLEDQPDGPGSGFDPTLDSGIAPRTCKYPDPALRLCIEFDDMVLSPKAHDASQYRLDADAVNLRAWLRDSKPAAATDFESKLTVAEHAMLDITDAITIETWMAVLGYHYAGLVSNDAQYGVGLDAEGRITCRVGSRTATAWQSIGTGTWRHVACVYDGEQLRVVVDGDVRRCQSETSQIPVAGTAGTRLAVGYIGAIDDIRIYARALGGDEICSHADRTSCATTCPSSRGDG